MVYWATIITFVGLAYLIASYRDLIFGEGLQEHRIREGNGYKIEDHIAKGYTLSTRNAILIALLSVSPIVIAFFLEGWLLLLLLAILTVVMLFYWLASSPFQKPIYTETSRKGKNITYELTGYKPDPDGSIGLFIFIGPAIVLGALVGWLLTRWIP